MDYQTAYSFIATQGKDYQTTPESFLSRLQQGKPPIPGQVTSILVALKMIFSDLHENVSLDRELCLSLFLLSYASRQYFNAAGWAGVVWPPLLSEDIDRIGLAVQSIFAGQWYDKNP